MQHVPEPQPLPPLGRRGVLATAGALSLAACTVRSPLEERPAPQPVSVDPDIAVRDAAQLAIAAQLAQLRATSKARARLRPRLTALISLHAAHLQALPSSQTPAATAGKTLASWADVQATERSLRHQLDGFAQRAESGGFARLLASMSAGIAQVVR